jgi:8-oxo-dGTP pyrophosphatase MutT (NUDIX family)
MTEPSPRRKRRRRTSRHRRRKQRLSTAEGAAPPATGAAVAELAAPVEPAPEAATPPPAAPEEKGRGARKGSGPTRAPRLETSAGGIVVRLVDGRPRVLLIRDSYRNWGFPKGHLEEGETAADAALREVREETGLGDVALIGEIDTIDWHFRFRGRLVHKTCHFFLMQTRHARTRPQRAEGITACRWVSIDEAERAISYANARDVLRRARGMLAADGLNVGPSPHPSAVERPS